MKTCSKCGGNRFNGWNRCMDCRNQRAKVRQLRILANGGSHTAREWSQLLANSPACAVCGRSWSLVPPRPDTRYKHTWTKGHRIPIYLGGSNSIENIQAECYQCNFRRSAGCLGTQTTFTKEIFMAASQERFSLAFSFILKSGAEVFPVQMKRRSSGNVAFRISRGGTGGNTLRRGEEVEESIMIRKVLDEEYAVRCSSKDGSIRGLYKQGHRSVLEVRRHSV